MHVYMYTEECVHSTVLFIYCTSKPKLIYGVRSQESDVPRGGSAGSWVCKGCGFMVEYLVKAQLPRL